MRNTGRAQAQSSCSLTNGRNLVRSHLFESALSTLPATERLAVRSSVEGDKEEEVGGEYANSSDGGKFLAGALAAVGEPVPVCGGEIGPGCEVDKAEVNDELDDLHDGDVALPPDTNAARALEVVPVHDYVDTEVQDDGDP